MAISLKNFSLSPNSMENLFYRSLSLFNNPARIKARLSSRDQASSKLSSQSESLIKRNVSVERTVTQKGNSLIDQTRNNIRTEAETNRQSVLSQEARRQVEGKVNGKKVFSDTENCSRTVSSETTKSTANETNASTSTLTREVAKNGNVLQSKTHIDLVSEGNLDASTQINRKTDTQSTIRTYDSSGKLKTDISSRQAVTVDQTITVARESQGEGNRDIQQTTTVENRRKGDTSLSSVRTQTEDIAHGVQSINTETRTNTATQVDKLDAGGDVVASRNYRQQVTSNDARNIETDRSTESIQTYETKNHAGQVETTSRGSYETHAFTRDETNTTGTIQNFNGEDALISQSDFERSQRATTVENRTGQNHLRSTVEREHGETVAATELRACNQAQVNTQIVSEQDGKITERTIDTKTKNQISGDIENRVDKNGNRTAKIEVEQITSSNTDDVLVGPNGKGRSVETDVYAAQTLQGLLEFNPQNNQVTAPGANVSPGAIVVSFGSNTGLRASFKLDNGTLNFDFSAERMTETDQEIVTGSATGKETAPIKGEHSKNIKASYEDIHFSGKVVSSVDEAGNRVISLEASVTDEGIGAMLVDGFAGFQGEKSKAELELKGTLAVNRQTTVNGDGTATRSQAEADLTVNRVENKNTVAENVRTLTPLNTSSGVSAGLLANNGALRFNFGIFNFGIEFVA